MRSTTFFDQGVLYTMKFDNQYGNSGTAIGSKPSENLVLQFSFSAPLGPIGQQTQQVFVYGPSFPTKVGFDDRARQRRQRDRLRLHQ